MLPVRVRISGGIFPGSGFSQQTTTTREKQATAHQTGTDSETSDSPFRGEVLIQGGVQLAL